MTFPATRTWPSTTTASTRQPTGCSICSSGLTLWDAKRATSPAATRYSRGLSRCNCTRARCPMQCPSLSPPLPHKPVLTARAERTTSQSPAIRIPRLPRAPTAPPFTTRATPICSPPSTISRTSTVLGECPFSAKRGSGFPPIARHRAGGSPRPSTSTYRAAPTRCRPSSPTPRACPRRSSPARRTSSTQTASAVFTISAPARRATSRPRGSRATPPASTAPMARSPSPCRPTTPATSCSTATRTHK